MRTSITSISLVLLAFLSGCQAQVRNARTGTAAVLGNCGMCKKTIEQAALVKGEAAAVWDEGAKRATLTYDSTRTDADAILKRIALAGYDNERYLATDAAYGALPECCRYERTLKKAPLAVAGTPDSGHDVHGESVQRPANADPLAPVFDAYFALKDALVASDAEGAMEQAVALDGAMRSLDAHGLPEAQQAVWADVMDAILPVLHPLGATSELAKQRTLFAQLTPHMLRAARAMDGEGPIYLDHCPMYEGGADWLSRDKAIRNPFYGSQMMTCGSVKETIGK